MGLFNAEEYFRDIAAKNKLCAAEGFRFCACSGPENIEEAIAQFRKENSFFIFVFEYDSKVTCFACSYNITYDTVYICFCVANRCNCNIIRFNDF